MDTKASAIIKRLHRLNGFTDHFPNLSLSPSTDSVTHLWEILSTGTPLCYIFDQLPEDEDFMKINLYSLTEGPYKPNSDRAMKRAIAIFALQVRAKPVFDKIPGCEIFNVEDLWDRGSTGGLVKVLNTVNAILDYLPQEAFKDDHASPDPFITNFNIVDYNNSLRNTIIQNILATEQKYVQDLELMQEYSITLSDTKYLAQDLARRLFPNLNNLLDFQRKLLMRLKITSKLPSQEQRWGQQFLKDENGFSVYDKYCINYVNTPGLVLANEEDLTPLDHIINVQTELRDFLFKPIQRVCQYPILLEPLVKTFSPETHKYYRELLRGLDATRRIAERISNAQRRAEKHKALTNLLDRVKNWKGHSPSSFGELVMYDLVFVTKSEVDRPYAMFLFEKIVILCKENKADRKKASSGQRNAIPSDEDAAAMWQSISPLVLKGRIYLADILSATCTKVLDPRFYPLTITWLEGTLHESFTLQCRHEQQRSSWHETFKRLMLEFHSETFVQPKLESIPRPMFPPERRHAINYHATTTTRTPGYSTALSRIVEHSEPPTDEAPNSKDEGSHTDSDGGDLENYSVASYPPSGRQTPVNERRLHRSRSLSIRPTKIDGNDANVLPTLRRAKSSSSLPRSLPELMTLPEDMTGINLRLPTGYNHFSSSNQSRFSIQMPFLQRNDTAGVQDVPIHSSSTVKVKVHFQSRIFVMAVPRTIEFGALQDEMMRKIRLWDPIRAEMGAQLRVRYQDEDGDMISLASTDDLQMALGEYEGQIRLFVT